MLIQQENDNNKGSFYVEEEGKRIAEMTYTMPATNKLIINHTEVSEELRGKNIGYQLVGSAVDYARANQVKIIPLCSFAAAVFKKKADYSDVLFK